MQKIETIIGLAGLRRADLSVCLGCKICASVCTVNDLEAASNPQALLSSLFLGQDVDADHPLVRYCTGCYRCTGACPWRIAVPEVVRAFRQSLDVASPFEKAFKGSVSLLGRVYEPYVFLKAVPFLVKGDYLRYMTKWVEYMAFHLPHRVRRRRSQTPGTRAHDAGNGRGEEREKEKR